MENNLKTIILTGASSGLGFETVKKIAKNFQNYRIILACRNLEKANSKKEEIEKETKNKNLVVMEIDTSSLQSVKNFVINYKNSSYGKIYSLICNAGIGGNSSNERTKDGYDVIFETNHLGHFLLVNSLLPLMEENGRIFVISSDMHDPPKLFYPNFNWIGAEKLAKPDEELSKSSIRYSYSKLCNLYFTYELIKKVGNKKLFINAFTPGFIPETGLSGGKKVPPQAIEQIKKAYPERIGDLEKSSQALCDLITMENFNANGAFFDRSTNIIKTSELSYNEINSKELWDLSESYVKNYY
jgi:NAD(P)-dependent dehydrogenase (short-subunit alcohol dehydrogenase family)